jgi:hypothetical protein
VVRKRREISVPVCDVEQATTLPRAAAPRDDHEETRRVQIEPDIILPSRFLGRTVATPEKRLLLAVLEEAVATLQRNALASDRHGRIMFTEVQAWFASDDAAWLYSFAGICDAVGIDAAYVRRGLARWLRSQQGPSPERVARMYRFPFRRVNGTRHRTNGQAEGMPRRA